MFPQIQAFRPPDHVTCELREEQNLLIDETYGDELRLMIIIWFDIVLQYMDGANLFVTVRLFYKHSVILFSLVYNKIKYLTHWIIQLASRLLG